MKKKLKAMIKMNPFYIYFFSKLNKVINERRKRGRGMIRGMASYHLMIADSLNPGQKMEFE